MLDDRSAALLSRAVEQHLARHGETGLLPYPCAEVMDAVAKDAGVKPNIVARYVVSLRSERLYFVLHKPKGLSSMRTESAGTGVDRTVYDRLPAGFPPLPHVGRLDKQVNLPTPTPASPFCFINAHEFNPPRQGLSSIHRDRG